MGGLGVFGDGRDLGDWGRAEEKNINILSSLPTHPTLPTLPSLPTLTVPLGINDQAFF